MNIPANLPEQENPRTLLKVYLDTNILLDDIYKRRYESRKLIKILRNNKVQSASSFYTCLEILNHLQTRQFMNRKIAEGWDLDDVLKNRSNRDLSSEDLKKIYREFVSDYDLIYSNFMQFYDLKQEGWFNVVELAGTSNITAADCAHVSTALESGCNVFVSNDTFLIKQMREYVHEQIKLPYACDSEGALQVLEELGIKDA